MPSSHTGGAVVATIDPGRQAGQLILGRTPLAACPPTTGRQRGDGARVDPPAAPDERDGVAACAASTAPTVASITAVSAATASLGIARVRSPVAGQPPGAACARSPFRCRAANSA